LTVTLSAGHTTGVIVPLDQVKQVKGWIENYHQVKQRLEKISDINRELLRRRRRAKRKT